MNWLTKIKKFGDKIKKNIKKKFPTKEEIANSDWTSCCQGPMLKQELEDNLWVCPNCNKHHRIEPRKRFDILFGKNNYEILKTPIIADDPLNWVDTKPYTQRLKEARDKTNQSSAVMVATGYVNGIKITTAAVNFNFIGGSFGASEVEAIVYAVQYSIDNQTPFFMQAAGGGMRMFESMIALSGMTKTTLAINELKKNHLPYIVLFTDPTAGGITASFSMLGDIHYSEKGALIAFAGKRVVQATVKEELPHDFQTAEFLEKHGFIDRVIERKDIKKELSAILSILLKRDSEVSSHDSNETSELSIEAREAS